MDHFYSFIFLLNNSNSNIKKDRNLYGNFYKHRKTHLTNQNIDKKTKSVYIIIFSTS